MLHQQGGRTTIWTLLSLKQHDFENQHLRGQNHDLSRLCHLENKMAENYPTLPESKVSIAPDLEMDHVEYTLRKRLPHKLPRRKNDIYVNMKTDFKAQLTRCQKLLDSGSFNEICIHGLGLAINRAINIALQLEANSFGGLQLAATTSTVELVDDLEPEADEGEPMTRTRNNSAIHIKVFRWLPKTRCMQGT